MARVVRPGGVIGFTRWTREGFNRDWVELEERFLTGGIEGSSPPLLGTEPTARAAVEPLAAHVEINRETLSITWSSVDAFTDALIAQDPYLHDLASSASTHTVGCVHGRATWPGPQVEQPHHGRLAARVSPTSA
jgi:hypothetical protein